MKPRSYFLTCSLVFLGVATVHLIRLVLGWNVSVAGHVAPQWISIVGVVCPGVLSAWGLSLAARAANPQE